MQTLYEILGIVRTATEKEIRRAYRKKALETHPDRNQNDTTAEARFKKIGEAYGILSDSGKRAVYNRFLDGGFNVPQPPPGNAYRAPYSPPPRPQKGGDLRVQMSLTPAEASSGLKREITVNAPTRCEDCKGTGAQGARRPRRCSSCRGSGRSMYGSCLECKGWGTVTHEKCPGCEGNGAIEKPRRITINVPAGVVSGDKIRVPGCGMPGPMNTPPGDLCMDLRVED